MKFARFLTIVPLIAAPAIHAEEPTWKTLFNGEDLTGWKTILEKQQPGEDPRELVKIRDGNIHMYADTPDSESVPFGVIQHESSHSRFHLTFEYRWGTKRFAPRKDAIRDAGVLYHVDGPEKVWPDSVEYQIQEGDTGDIVFLPKAGLTWMNPDPKSAPEGQGDPGMLPESGGILRDFTGTDFAYIGRFPVLDTMDGWNRVDVIVQADETAEHIINGSTVARIDRLRKKDGSPAIAGKVALQLEGAEILYRDVKIRDLDLPLRATTRFVAMSSVKGVESRKLQLQITNPSKTARPLDLKISGKDSTSFKATVDGSSLAPGSSATVNIEFTPSGDPGRYSAGLQIGSKDEGVFVILQGIHLKALEGKNEPPLQLITQALGIPLNVGGKTLELDSRAEVIGQSEKAGLFKSAGPGKIKVTPLARFSPPGVVPFGISLEGGETMQRIGSLAGPEIAPDGHQCVFPPLAGHEGSVEIDAPEKPFAFYMEGHKYVSWTDPARKTAATIPHTARVYPVRFLQGRALENAWLVGFEEAENGDYQDAVFLLENVTPVK